uniref:SWIM-type domain-containing protein n=1 Tax=Trichogramma kaykai TaxID=54128 RepID=A0ABD2W9T1_9HYME
MSGINNETVATFSRVTLKFFDKPCPLDVVRDDFPIEDDGIVGMEFLRTQKAVLSFAVNRIFIGDQSFRELPHIEHKTYYLRARKKTLVDLDCDFRERSSYVPRIKAGPGIFAGECLVKTQNHRGSLFNTNSTFYDINLGLPLIKRYDFETSARVSLARPTVKPPHGLDMERINSILKELNLDSLNSDERAHVINLVAKFSQQFHLPSDHLSMTKATTHKIVTTDDIPINVKQYRHPPYLHDKIRKQITELITNDIVEESDSSYNSPLWIVPKKPGPAGEKKWRSREILIVSYVTQTSKINDIPHEVSLKVEVSECKKVICCHCTCPAGAGEKCKHIFGSLLYVNRYQIENLQEYCHFIKLNAKIKYKVSDELKKIFFETMTSAQPNSESAIRIILKKSMLS